jgi:hypothetical protein
VCPLVESNNFVDHEAIERPDKFQLLKFDRNNVKFSKFQKLILEFYSLRPVKSVHLEILGQIMEWSKKCIGNMQATISLFFNYPTSNELSACRNEEDYV